MRTEEYSIHVVKFSELEKYLRSDVASELMDKIKKETIVIWMR